ncbi:MAG: trypsin-like peptidase domain-containing protein [Defluviitaleaceae bacterium]|nr:trypsin-like peptidase domain-containing protein [Defluviitaleaceae bacterium]MCL2276078.1 trypsin-like peptidase domain-containing protein [Defluviitaleaceae bacterium]
MKAIKTMVTVLCVITLMVGSGYIGAYMTQRNLTAQAEAPIQETAPAFINGSIEAVSLRAIAGREMSMPDLFDYANPSVVAISTQIMGRNAFGQQVPRPSAGSGFLVSADGYIVTNNHVIESAREITVLMHDGREFPAEVIGRDPLTDLAVIKIDVRGFPFLRFGNSDTARVGEQVAAIGNPLGELANSMTVGHLSALNRDVFIDGAYYNKLQTDAAVNRGNSGGPLLNAFGEVIGVVSAKHAGTGIEGLGFAIPATQAQEITAHLIEYGFVRGRAMLGVTISANHSQRVQIAVVAPNSAAAEAGLRVGDILLEINGEPLHAFTDLRRALDNAHPSDTWEILVRRQGQEITLVAVLGEAGA